MTHEPTVSVVVPSFQQAAYIEETVVSVLSQEGVDFELVVSDHSSTDDTWQRLQSYAQDARVRLMRVAPGGGAPRNWNEVTAAARGRFVKLLPGDDRILPGTLARQAGILERDPRVVLTAGRRNVVDARGRVVMGARGLGPLTERVSGAEAIRATVRAGTNLFGEPGAVMMRRTALVEAGMWDTASAYAIDVSTYIRVLERGDFAPDAATASTFRLSGGQWSVRLVREQAAQMAVLHAGVHDRMPRAVSDADVRRGDRRARLLAHQRRIVYTLLKGRMS